VISGIGHGPYIPCIPAIVLSRRLARGLLEMRGATPCLDLIDLDTYLKAFEGLNISVVRDAVGWTITAGRVNRKSARTVMRVRRYGPPDRD
jgi:hypothetical protein